MTYNIQENPLVERIDAAMENSRPRGREKNATGPGKSVQRRGAGLGTRPVGEAGGYQDRTPQSGGIRGPGSRGDGIRLIVLLLALLLGGSFGRISGLNESNSEFLSDRALDDEEMAQYLAEKRFPAEALLWQEGEDGVPVIRLSEEQWGLVHSLELSRAQMWEDKTSENVERDAVQNCEQDQMGLI